MASCSSSHNKASRVAAGNAMFDANRRALSKNDPRLKLVKKCVDQAISQVFPGGHAQVQLQGSTAKGTALQGKSDWDFLVRLDNTIPTVTQQERMQVHNLLLHNLAASGILYDIRIAEKRLQLRYGSYAGVTLPDADVLFERFKHYNATIPKSDILAASHAGQVVARYIKRLPEHFSNLCSIKRVEELVAQVDTHLRCQQGLKKEELQGRVGFDRLATETLQAVAGVGSLQSARAVRTALQNAGLVDVQWRNVAQNIINKRKNGQPWPGPRDVYNCF